MPNRIIKESINESKGLSEVSFFAEDLYKRLITYADDYGRFNADCQIMRARLYPREIEIVSELDIEDALIELSGIGKVAFYTSEAKKEIYGCLPKWSDHQRIRESKNKCPDPDDTSVNDWYLRRFIPMDMKIRTVERDNFKCKVCGKYISSIENAHALVKKGSGLFHIDHIVPVSQGGRATMENLRLTCPKCNQSRKKRFTFDEILEITHASQNFAESCGESPGKSALIQSNPESNPESNNICAEVEGEKKYPYKEIIDYLNKKTGKTFKASSKTTQRDIRARISEGYTVDDFKRVIDIKVAKWNVEPKNGEKDMRDYLRPITLFGTKFESYLQEKEEPQKKKVRDNNNFERRSYDMNDFERRMIDAQRRQALV